MGDFRKSAVGFSPFAGSSLSGYGPRLGRSPAVNAEGCDHLGAHLRAFYGELLAAPLPEHLLRLVKQLEARDRKNLQ